MSWDGTLQRRRAIASFDQLMKISRRDPTVGFFWCLVTLHLLFWTVLATLTQPNLPADTLEMLESGRNFAWGYATQPPLGVWLASAVSQLAAPSNWPVYLLAQLCGVVSVWSAWMLGRQFLHPWTALCAAFVLLGGYSCTIAATAFSGDLLAGAFWSLSIYLFHSALTQERRRYWAATGLCLALGFLSSYGTLLLLLTMFIFTLVDDRARRCWDSSWPFLAGMAMLAMLMPHFLWLTRHQFLTVQAGIERPASVAHHLVQPLSFLGTQLLCVIPVILLLTPLVAWFSFEEPARSEEDDREFARRYLLWMTCLPPAVIFGLALMAGPSSGLFAGVTNWSYLGVVTLMWGHLNETRLAWRRSIIRIGAAVGMFAAALVALNIMLPQIQQQGASTQFPGAELSRQIESLWASFGYGSQSPVIAGPANLVRNATWYSQGTGVRSYADLNPARNPDVNDQTLIRDGGVIVWNADTQNVPTQADLQARFGQVSVVNPVDLPWQTDSGLPAVRVGMAVVHPASGQQRTNVSSTIPTASQPTPATYFAPGSSGISLGSPATPPAAVPTRSSIPAPIPAASPYSAVSSTIPQESGSAPRPLPRGEEQMSLPPHYPAATYTFPELTSGTPPTSPGFTASVKPVPAPEVPARPVFEAQPTPRSEFVEQ